MSIKVGQRYKYVDNCMPSLTKGKVYTITKIWKENKNGYGDWVYFIDDKGIEDWKWSSVWENTQYFELVEDILEINSQSYVAPPVAKKLVYDYGNAIFDKIKVNDLYINKESRNIYKITYKTDIGYDREGIEINLIGTSELGKCIHIPVQNIQQFDKDYKRLPNKGEKIKFNSGNKLDVEIKGINISIGSIEFINFGEWALKIKSNDANDGLAWDIVDEKELYKEPNFRVGDFVKNIYETIDSRIGEIKEYRYNPSMLMWEYYILWTKNGSTLIEWVRENMLEFMPPCKNNKMEDKKQKLCKYDINEKVIYVGNDSEFSKYKGKIGKVIDCGYADNSVAIVMEDGQRIHTLEDCLCSAVLCIKREPYKVGDKVKITSHQGNWFNFNIGDICEISEVLDRKVYGNELYDLKGKSVTGNEISQTVSSVDFVLLGYEYKIDRDIKFMGCEMYEMNHDTKQIDNYDKPKFRVLDKVDMVAGFCDGTIQQVYGGGKYNEWQYDVKWPGAGTKMHKESELSFCNKNNDAKDIREKEIENFKCLQDLNAKGLISDKCLEERQRKLMSNMGFDYDEEQKLLVKELEDIKLNADKLNWVRDLIIGDKVKWNKCGDSLQTIYEVSENDKINKLISLLFEGESYKYPYERINEFTTLYYKADHSWINSNPIKSTDISDNTIVNIIAPKDRPAHTNGWVLKGDGAFKCSICGDTTMDCEHQKKWVEEMNKEIKVSFNNPITGWTMANSSDYVDLKTTQVHDLSKWYGMDFGSDAWTIGNNRWGLKEVKSSLASEILYGKRK